MSYPDEVQMDPYDRIALTSDSGSIDPEYIWEESVQVSDENDE